MFEINRGDPPCEATELVEVYLVASRVLSREDAEFILSIVSLLEDPS